jgi:FkbM family methyltransferase
LANKPLVERLAGASDERVWSIVPGGEVLAPLNSFVGRAAYYVGDLDRKVTWVCSRLVRSGDTVLDIGANIGMVTVCLSALAGEDGNVHAFEPNPAMHPVLEETFDRNQSANVCLHPVALGAVPGVLELRIPRWNTAEASLVRNLDSPDCDVVSVPVRRLTDVVAEAGITSIRLIKIDVEGFEADVLEGGLEVLHSVRPDAILFELNERTAASLRDEPVIKVLREHHYTLFSIPKCLFRMRLERFDPDNSDRLPGHDFLAIAEGDSQEEIAGLVNSYG